MASELLTILEDMTGVGEDKDYIVKMFKKLEEENKKLKEELQQEKDRFSDLASLHNDKSIKIAQLKEEIATLKRQ